jgi:hypothetical protein
MLSFPSGCLAFVKNVHYATNKTALKHLLSQAFAADEPEDGTSRARRLEIDYIDYQKNMDTVRTRDIYIPLCGRSDNELRLSD